MIRNIVFDLDGTLTDTLQDLANSTNYSLLQMGWKERSLDEIRRFVGNGVRRLMERAVPANVTNEEFERCFALFQQHYLVHCQDTTGLYPGVEKMLQDVRQRGYRTAIVSNKLQAGVDELYDAFFRDVVDVAIGERGGISRKPAPDMVQLALRELGATLTDTVYVGESEVDVETARNSGLPCISVLWGFRDKAQLAEAGATVFIEHPSQLLCTIETMF